jgi:PAS domain S-box-containing protein
VNEAYAGIVGYTREELLDRGFQGITYPEDLEADVNMLAALLEGRRPAYHLEKRYVRKDGGLVWVSLSVGLARDGSGRPAYCSVVVEDITARKRAEEALRESEERFRLLVQGVRDCAIYLLASDGTVTSWSAAAEQMFGYREEEIVGQHRRVFFTDEQQMAGRPEKGLEEALAIGRSEEEAWRVRKDGSRFWANVLITPLRDAGGKLRGFGNVTRDFTDRKRAGDALRESEERLRASEAALREADRNKDQFLAMLSHELRNPLTPIRNSLYILDRAAPGDQQARRAQKTIQRQIGQLTWLVDDLLDVTRIAHGKIQLQRERLDLNQLAHRTVEDHRAIFAKSDVRVEVFPAPAEVWVNGDRVRLAQVISNLLQNAAKFTPHGGKTTISVESNPSRHQAVLTVRDTGRGIQPEMMPRLFQAFSQVDSTIDRSKGGLGLGLALVKGLVGMHGGSVTAASDGVGKGAAFTITLPLDVAADRLVPARSAVDGGRSTPRRVLVIEDNEDTANTLREVLEFDEHVVDVAYTGREGIERARAFHPDVVLCDISLPEMDGYAVARAMRADPELARFGLVALSGYAQPEDVAIAREAGFDAHLAKPPSFDAIARAVAECGSARQEQRTQEQRRPAGAPDSSSRT